MIVSAIQSRLFWEDKAANLGMFMNKINAISGSHIIVLPEMFSTGFSMKPGELAETMDGPTIQWMKNTAAEKRVILTGSLIIEESGKYYNRMIWMLPDGTMGHYDKRHLFAYAGEDKQYEPGKRRCIASVNGWKINLVICYDLRFPVWLRQSATEHGDPEYDVLIVVANWPAKRTQAWKTLLQARAIENQCYVVGVNRVGDDGHGIAHSGDSMIIGPMGEVLQHETDTEIVLTEKLDKELLYETREKLPFLRDRDRFTIY